MWGTGASATQTQGAGPASDWLRWEQAGRAPVSGDGNGFGTRYAEDFAILAGLGLTHHRMSIDWSRIEPEEGKRYAGAIEHYRDILTAAREAGIDPWVCLFHFTLPNWVAEKGGFQAEETRTNFWARHVDFVAETFGDLVAGWQPVNETNYYARIAYSGSRPPGVTDREAMAIVDVAIHLATAEAAATLRQTGLPVSSIFGYSPALGHDDEPATTKAVERFYENSWGPGLGLFRDGVLRVYGAPVVERPDLVGCFDLIGFSYYATMGYAHGQPTIYPADAPVSPLGYGIWADGLGLALDRLHAEIPGVPLLIAEYGIGTQDDAVRAAYIARGLEMTTAALGRGIDVRGFFHWTAVDNYEWLHGYDVSFGIIDGDRVIRPSARVLQAAAADTPPGS